MMIKTQKILLLLFVLVVSACGYHLRGSIDLPEELKSIYLQGASGQLTKQFKRTLRSSGGELVENIEQAGMVVDVVKERMDRRVLSLSTSGRANEYELNYLLDFIFLDAQGQALSELQKIELSRDYFNEQEEVLGKNNEEDLIRDEMYRQAVQSIFNRGRVALAKK